MSQKEWKAPEEQSSLNKLNKVHMKSKTGAASTGPTQVCNRPSVFIV